MANVDKSKKSKHLVVVGKTSNDLKLLFSVLVKLQEKTWVLTLYCYFGHWISVLLFLASVVDSEVLDHGLSQGLKILILGEKRDQRERRDIP